MVESSPALANLSREGIIRAKRVDNVGPLLAHTQQELLQVLRFTAGMLMQKERGYYHCEWAWDGKRLWLVQADRADPSDDVCLGNKYIDSTEDFDITEHTEFSWLRHFTATATERWKKLKRPTTFQKLGWPTAHVYVLTGEQWKSSSTLGHRELSEELSILSKHPVVVRCDIATDVPREDILLSTSNPTTDINELLDFMNRESVYFRDQGLLEQDWAFLLAVLVPARASAMIHAHPDGQVARVDSVWGFPDGLLFLPHDTYFFYPADDRLEVRVRYKGLTLLAKGGSWTYAEVGEPHDWEQVLSVEEIRTLARWGLDLARACGKDIQLMALARIGGRQGGAYCLPWHFTTLTIPAYTQSRAALMTLEDVEVIESQSDLTTFSEASFDHRIKGYVIRPDRDLIRDTDFIRASARLAAAHGIPILFEGSLLGHAYYLMVQEGAVVVPITPENPEESSKRYDKLVRDKIPAVIERAGGLARIQMLGKDEALMLLGRKLIEEAYEVWHAPQEMLAGELADALEVIDSIRVEAGIDEETLREIKEKKRNARGGFDDLIYLKETVAKPLESLDLKKGLMPLFLDDQTDGNFRGGRDIRPQYIELTEAENDRVIAEFSVPSIPPVERGQRLTEVESFNGDFGIACRYESETITVSIERIEARAEINTQQLNLFPEEPDRASP